MAIGIKAKTGEVCPESGIWQSTVNAKDSMPYSKGKTMPFSHGEIIIWQLIGYV